MNTWDKCKNCGGDYGLHHYQINQCPVGGQEAAIGRKQEWMTLTFQKEEEPEYVGPEANRIAELESTIQDMRRRLEHLEDVLQMRIERQE
jgi:hypothetical protein